MNKFQIAAASAFANGEHAHVKNLTEADMVGDTLFLFILRELEDVETSEDARHRIYRAICDLNDVNARLETIE